MNILVNCEDSKLKEVDLSYNNISQLVQNSIKKLLKEINKAEHEESHEIYESTNHTYGSR